MSPQAVDRDARGAREPEGPLLFAEDGWHWAWVLAAPVGCVAAGLFEWATGAPVHTLMLLVCAIGSMLSHGVMIAATRVHGRVRLTPTELHEGTEVLPVSEVAEVLPPPPASTGRFGGPARDEEPWETARTLGELRELGRGREAIGLRLRSGALVRAWAKDADGLRAALGGVVGRTPGSVVDGGGPSGVDS